VPSSLGPKVQPDALSDATNTSSWIKQQWLSLLRHTHTHTELFSASVSAFSSGRPARLVWIQNRMFWTTGKGFSEAGYQTRNRQWVTLSFAKTKV